MPEEDDLWAHSKMLRITKVRQTHQLGNLSDISFTNDTHVRTLLFLVISNILYQINQKCIKASNKCHQNAQNRNFSGDSSEAEQKQVAHQGGGIH